MENNENLMALLNKDYMPIIYKNIKKFNFMVDYMAKIVYNLVVCNLRVHLIW